MSNTKKELSPLEAYYTTGQGYGPLNNCILWGQTGWESYYTPKNPHDKDKDTDTKKVECTTSIPQKQDISLNKT